MLCDGWLTDGVIVRLWWRFRWLGCCLTSDIVEMAVDSDAGDDIRWCFGNDWVLVIAYYVSFCSHSSYINGFFDVAIFVITF